MEINNKLIGALLSIIGAVGTFASIAMMIPLQGYCPLVMEFYHQLLLVMIPLFIILLAIGLYLYMKKDKIKFKTIIKATKIEKILTPDERRIIEFLKGKKSVTQADIRRGLDLPRATLSILLSRMEKRKLIRKERIGKTNYVTPMEGL